jgi:hypothetical protein
MDEKKMGVNKEEIETLDLLVNQYIDFAELQTRLHKVMYTETT